MHDRCRGAVTCCSARRPLESRSSCVSEASRAWCMVGGAQKAVAVGSVTERVCGDAEGVWVSHLGVESGEEKSDPKIRSGV